MQDVAYELGDRSYNQGNHSVDMLMAYLPKEKILFNADLYSPPAQGAAPAAAVAEHAHARSRTSASSSSMSRSMRRHTGASARMKSS